jgi:uncharacterized protein (UPF0333 family)
MLNNKGQFSVDLLIAVSIFMVAVAVAIYYTISSFTPYEEENIYLQALAYKVAMLLAEDAGLNVTNITKSGNVVYAKISTNWEVALNEGNGTFVRQGNVTRIGLAKEAPLKSSYERCLPCCLSETKVKVFFNNSTWDYVVGWNDLENLSSLLGLNLSIRYGFGDFSRIPLSFNVSLRYMNGSVVKIDNVTCQIGEPIPVNGNVVKFERIVVIYDESKPYYEASDFRRLVVCVW